MPLSQQPAMVDASRVLVIGGGVGGLAVAIRLQALGHQVTVVERNEQVGGKLAVLADAGYTFDIGPSLMTLPAVFEELCALAGTSLDAEMNLVRLDPQFRYKWPDGSALTIHDDPAATVAAVEEFVPGAGDQWEKYLQRARRIWEVSERTFFAGPMDNPLALMTRMRSPLDLWAIDSLRSLHRSASRAFSDPRLVQLIDRYATYSGSSPYRAPATLACIPHIESHFGCWYPMGGLGELSATIERLARRMGVEIRTSTEVTQLHVVAGRVTTADLRVTESGQAGRTERCPVDLVVANADAEHLYRDLLGDAAAVRRVQRADRSSSGFVICAGVRGITPELSHHNLWFSEDYRTEFAQIAAGQLPTDPTIYGCVSSVTDPSQAPAGNENWFLLINTAPSGAGRSTTGTTPGELDRSQATDRVLEGLARRGVDLRDRIDVLHTLTPSDIAERYRAPGGAIYGTSSNGRRAAFLRPSNRTRYPNLFLVGGSSHPGGGLPLVTMSARIVAELVGAP
jgi:phytoene desaturase